MFRKSKSNCIDFTKITKGVEDIVEKMPYVKKKRKKRAFLKFLKYFFFLFLFFLITSIIVVAFNYINLKSIYDEAIDGKKNLETAGVEIKIKNYIQAELLADKAEGNFKIVSSNIEKYKGKLIVNILPFLRTQIDDLTYLAKTAEKLSSVVKKAAMFGVKMDRTINAPNKKFSSLTSDEKGDILNFIHSNSADIEGIRDETFLAIENVKKIKHTGILRLVKRKLIDFENILFDAQEFLIKAVPLAKMIPELLGYPEQSTFLLILQNNDELRPTGGFIGTYGILQIHNSDITRADTHDIYHIDMPVKDLFNEPPPPPIRKYLKIDQWFMRDANWSPNWPTSAKRIEWFYEKENALLPEIDQVNNYNEEFNGVIAITPDFVAELLSIIGQITINDITYNKDNFQDLLQYEVERGYIKKGVSSWQRKEVIGTILSELKIKLLDLNTTNLYKTISILSDHLDKKNILFYVKNEDVQSIVSNANWAGEVKSIKPTSDYFFIVDSNMGSFKTDNVVNRNVSYTLSQEVDGAYANLKINYIHNGDFDWRTTTYRTYTRIYVPLGSELIKVGGFNNSEEIKVDKELGKTVFGVFLTVDPGEIGNLSFTYKLPREISINIENGNYKLIAQKQPGNYIESFSVDLDFLDKVKSFQPIESNTKQTSKNKIFWKTDLNNDKNFTVEF